jgi:uncharacterized damage-inducible protein DinB
MTVEENFLSFSIKRFLEQKSLGEKAISQLGDKDLLIQPPGNSNSIAVIIMHLHGNMVSRWTNFLSEDGEKPWRQRDLEFEERVISRQEIFDKWEEGWNTLLDSLRSLKPSDLNATITIRTEPVSVIDAILRQLAHYSYHVGQIVYLARLLKPGEWQSLSIPKGGSDDYNKKMEQPRH